MALKFQIRGTQKDAYYAAAKKDHYVFSASDSDVPVVASAVAGAFGGSVIDLSAGPGIEYFGMDNCPINARSFTLLMGIIPKWTGTPANLLDVIQWGGGNIGAVAFGISTAGTMTLFVRNVVGGTFCFNGSVPGALTFVNGTKTDIWVRWTGLAADPLEVWQAQFGVAPTLVGTLTASTDSEIKSMVLCPVIRFNGNILNGNASDFKLNECVIWDSYEDPASFGARANFIPTTASPHEGYGLSSDIPANSDIRSGVLSGTCHVPAAADVRSGVAVDATTGLLDLPNVSDVLGGVVFDHSTKTGTLVLVTNYFQDKKLIARSDANVNVKSITVSQGDQLLLSFTAYADTTTTMDLTGATLETEIKGITGLVTISNSDHVIDPDQTIGGNRGKFTVLLSAANSLALNAAKSKDMLTKVTQGSFVTFLHGTDVLNVLVAPPID